MHEPDRIGFWIFSGNYLYGILLGSDSPLDLLGRAAASQQDNKSGEENKHLQQGAHRSVFTGVTKAAFIPAGSGNDIDWFPFYSFYFLYDHLRDPIAGMKCLYFLGKVDQIGLIPPR
jgi:hypothetical protein